MWDWFCQFLFECLKLTKDVVGDWGMAIIVLTLIIRILLTPLTVKGMKSSARMQALQPKMKALQEKYANDPQAQREAIMQFQAENKFNPLSGCLPTLLQMPVFFALFTVTRDFLPAEAHFYSILDSLSLTPTQAFETGGLSAAAIFIFMDLLFAVLTIIPIVLNAKNSSEDQQKQMKVMAVVMSLFMLYIGWIIPVGALIYYDTTSLWGVVQQLIITQKVTDKIKAEEGARMGVQPLEVDVVRKEHKPRPRKK